ncbi:MAG: LysM peptidoglycan-binding domain-containing protein [Treponema sp.]|nr:LysM peptidoglycan-binding domain-containing protein [Candidatus Treponema equifaecale]
MKCDFYKVVFFLIFILGFSSASAEKVHEVQKGETLYSISKSYGVSVEAVKSANDFSGNDIKIGQKIKIPEGTSIQKNDSADTSTAATVKQPAKTENTQRTETKTAENKPAETKNAETKGGESVYVVQKGETWFGISKKYGVSVAELQKLNGADSNSALKVGQKLKVPVTGTGASVTAVAKKEEKAPEKTTETKKTEIAKVPELKVNDPHNYSDKKGDATLVWPVKASDVTYIKGKIGGVCLTSKKDESVTSIRAGTVMFSGSYRGFGNVVFIQSKTGHIYAYTGLGSIEVAKGDYINYASQIGTAGVDSYTGKSQVSLMVFQNGQPIDPAKAPRG